MNAPLTRFAWDKISNFFMIENRKLSHSTFVRNWLLPQSIKGTSIFFFVISQRSYLDFCHLTIFSSHSIFSLWSKLLKIVPKMKIRDKDCPSFFQAVYWIFAMKRLKLWRLWPNSNAPAPFSRTFSTPKPTMLSSTVVFFSSTQWWNVKLG